MRCSGWLYGQLCGYGLLLFTTVALANDEASYMEEADFIEFMGSWETTDGEWLPPDEIVELRLPKESKQKQREDVEASEADTDE